MIKNRLKESLTTKPALQRLPEGILQSEEKNKYREQINNARIEKTIKSTK